MPSCLTSYSHLCPACPRLGAEGGQGGAFGVRLHLTFYLHNHPPIPRAATAGFLPQRGKPMTLGRRHTPEVALGLSSRQLPTLKPFTWAERSSQTESAIPRSIQRGLEPTQVASRGPDKHPHTRGVLLCARHLARCWGGVIRLCHHPAHLITLTFSPFASP